MGTKVISIMDDAYDLLVKYKRPRESFSEVIRRLAPKRGNLMDFAGAWSHLSKEDITAMKNDIAAFDNAFTRELLQRAGRP